MINGHHFGKKWKHTVRPAQRSHRTRPWRLEAQDLTTGKRQLDFFLSSVLR